MATLKQSYLGLVELADYEHLIDLHGADLAKQLFDEFVKRLKNWIRTSDQSSLLKDNRYLVVLRGVGTRAELELATAKLSRLFESPHSLLGERTPLDIHAGFALLDGTSPDTSQEIKEARIALRQAKQAATLYKVFDPDSRRQLDNEHKLLKALQAALERGEFHLYYQPKIHAGYNNVVGAEALIRWHTQDKKVISPHFFMDVAERHEIIRPITWWAIKTAIARLAKWPAQVSVSVNTPPTLLLDDEILTVVRDALDIHGVKPSRFTLEVTESVMVDNPQQVLKQLAELRALGIKVSIDDFGTGYSSLAYFRDLPADELKIDKIFVQAMQQSDKDLAIVKAVIDLAHNFSLNVVAEGVEDQATAKHLSDLGCDQLQVIYTTNHYRSKLLRKGIWCSNPTSITRLKLQLLIVTKK